MLAQAGSGCGSAAQATISVLLSAEDHLPDLCILALSFALPCAGQLPEQLFSRATHYTYWG